MKKIFGLIWLPMFLCAIAHAQFLDRTPQTDATFAMLKKLEAKDLNAAVKFVEPKAKTAQVELKKVLKAQETVKQKAIYGIEVEKLKDGSVVHWASYELLNAGKEYFHGLKIVYANEKAQLIKAVQFMDSKAIAKEVARLNEGEMPPPPLPMRD